MVPMHVHICVRADIYAHAHCNISHTCIGDPDWENIQILCALLKRTEFFIVSYGLL